MPGYSGVIPHVKANNIFGMPYAHLTNNYLKGNFEKYEQGPKGNELDNKIKEDKFITTNQLIYPDYGNIDNPEYYKQLT